MVLENLNNNQLISDKEFQLLSIYMSNNICFHKKIEIFLTKYFFFLHLYI